MIDERSVEPTGDLRKDTMMFNQAYGIDHCDAVLRGIRYILEVDRDADRVPDRLDDLSHLEESELSSVQTEISIHGPHIGTHAPENHSRRRGSRRSQDTNFRLTFLDVHSLSKAISCCFFSLTKIHLVSCGLSSYSIRQLCRSFKYVRKIDEVLIDRNPVCEAHEIQDEEAYARVSSASSVSASSSTDGGPGGGDASGGSGSGSGGGLSLVKIRPLLVQPHHSILHPELGSSSSGRRSGRHSAAAAASGHLLLETSLGPSLAKTSVILEKRGSAAFFPLGMLLRHRIMHLVLRDCGISDEQCKAVLCPVLAVHSQLLSLSLWGNNLTDESCGAIGSALLTNRSLLGIDLGRNPGITDAGISRLVQNAFGRIEVNGWEALHAIREKTYTSANGERVLVDVKDRRSKKGRRSGGASASARSSENREDAENPHPEIWLPSPTWLQELFTEGHYPEVASRMVPMSPSPAGRSSGRGGSDTTIPLLSWDSETTVLSKPDIEQVVAEKKVKRGRRVRVRRSGRGTPQPVEPEPEPEPAAPPKPWVFEITGNPTLQCLVLSGNREISDSSARLLPDRIRSSGLKRVDLGFTDVTEETLSKIGVAMSERWEEELERRRQEEEMQKSEERTDSDRRRRRRKKRSGRGDH